MSKALVTETEALEHLRLDVADGTLTLNIEAASEAVLSFMEARGDFLVDSAGDVPQDSNGPIGIPYRVKAAVLLTLTSLYEDRKGDAGDKNAVWVNLRLPSAAMSLLRNYYDPSLA